MRNKCVKIAFQTPSSNSWSKSTSSNLKKLTPNSWRQSEKAFFDGSQWDQGLFCIQSVITYICWHIWELIQQCLDMVTINRDTFSKIKQCAAAIWRRLISSSTCVFLIRRLISGDMPIFGKSVFLIKHWGHGQAPRNLIPAMRSQDPTGVECVSVHHVFITKIDYLLLWVISQVAKEAWKDSPLNSISTTYHNSIPIYMHKFLVKEKIPHALVQFSLAMSICFTSCRFAKVGHIYFLKVIR